MSGPAPISTIVIVTGGQNDTAAVTLNSGDTLSVTRAGFLLNNGTGLSPAVLAGGANTITIAGTLFSKNYFGIYSTQGNHTVTVTQTGTIFGDDAAIQFDIGGNEITNHGSLTSANVGLTAVGGNNVVTNFGLISGPLGALYLGGSANVLTNSGFIVSDSAALGPAASLEGGSVTNSGTIQGWFGVGFNSLGPLNSLLNTGTIMSLTAGGAGVLGSSIKEVITNNGSIQGFSAADMAVSLNAGDDTYDGRGGTLLGSVRGGNGADTIYGGTGAETLMGDAQNDYLDGGAGADSLDGGPGDDTFVLRNEGNAFNTLADVSGFDTVTTTISRSLGTWGFIEGLTLVEGAGGIAGYGNGLGNALIGNSGNNRLEGLNGSDTILGMRGTDVLVGGNDGDTFKFMTILDSTVGNLRDVITDLDDFGDDIIDLSPIAGVTNYIGQAAFNAAGQVRAVQSGANVLIQINTTGTTATPESEILLLNTTLGVGVGQFAGDDLLL